MARATRAGPWRQKKDPLWRGDGTDGLQPVDPAADPSLVRHILSYAEFPDAASADAAAEDVFD
jgi:hypothetical protein